jgi:hypothetical protein
LYLVFPWVVIWFVARSRRTVVIAGFVSLALA